MTKELLACPVSTASRESKVLPAKRASLATMGYQGRKEIEASLVKLAYLDLVDLKAMLAFPASPEFKDLKAMQDWTASQDGLAIRVIAEILARPALMV